MANSDQKKKLIRTTALLVLLVAVVCPPLYLFVDLDAAKYAHDELSRSFVHAVNQTSNFDDYIIIACIVSALYSLWRLKNKVLFQKFVFPPLSSLAAGILTHLLKWPLGRWRPKAWFEHHMYGFEFCGPIKAGLTKHFGVHTAFCDTYPFARTGILISFPSGHSSSMMGIMAAIAILKPKYRWPCFIVAILFGAARVIESAHYPSDVIGGLVVGYIAAHWLRYYLVSKNWLPDTDYATDLDTKE